MEKLLKDLKLIGHKQLQLLLKKRHNTSIGALPKVHSSHNLDYSDVSAQLRGHRVKKESSAFMSGESNFTRKSHFTQEEIKSVENLLHFK